MYRHIPAIATTSFTKLSCIFEYLAIVSLYSSACSFNFFVVKMVPLFLLIYSIQPFLLCIALASWGLVSFVVYPQVATNQSHFWSTGSSTRKLKCFQDVASYLGLSQVLVLLWHVLCLGHLVSGHLSNHMLALGRKETHLVQGLCKAFQSCIVFGFDDEDMAIYFRKVNCLFHHFYIFRKIGFMFLQCA